MTDQRSGFGPLLLIAGFVALTAGVWVFLRAESPGALRIGAVAPEISLPDLEGRTLTLGAHRGDVVFVNFWATWCAPCEKEAPSLQRLYATFAERGFQVLAISIDEPSAADQVAAFRTKHGLTFPILLDAEKVAYDRYHAYGVPETLIVDRSGAIVERFIGPRDFDDPRFSSVIDKLLGPQQGRTGDG